MKNAIAFGSLIGLVLVFTFSQVVDSNSILTQITGGQLTAQVVDIETPAKLAKSETLIINQVKSQLSTTTDPVYHHLMNLTHTNCRLRYYLGVPCDLDPVITGLNPAFGPIGTRITISGRGFSIDPTVDVAFVGSTNVGSPIDGEKHFKVSPVNNQLIFTVPSSITQQPGEKGGSATEVTVVPGKYSVVVENSSLRSLPFWFTVTSSTTPSIKVLSPNGGETWTIGSQAQIRWSVGLSQASGITEDSVIVISLPGTSTGFGYIGVIDRQGIVLNSKTITVPNNVIAGDVFLPLNPGFYKLTLRLYDRMPCLGLCSPTYPKATLLAEDSSDGYINIVSPGTQNLQIISPNGGESFAIGQKVAIKWLATGFSSVRLALWQGAIYRGDIVTTTDNDGSYEWTVPSRLIPGTGYKVRVRDPNIGAATTFDDSDAGFTISSAGLGTAGGQSFIASIMEAVKGLFGGE